MAEPTPAVDLLDLKMMPAWVNEPARANDYADFEGEDVERQFDRRGTRPPGDRKPRARRPEGRDQRAGAGKRPDRKRGPERKDPRRDQPREDQRPRETQPVISHVAVRFIPHAAAFESVVAQIKSGSITYSVFALARMFLDKPERYDVQLTANAELPLFQLGEDGAVAADRRILEGSAFATAKDDFYSVEVTQTEPIKGNFTNVARDRASGTLLGPTNHHAYQPQLRTLYEQRYSRRMSFPDFQRQIEIVSDPAVVEQWKEQARSITTFNTKDETPTTFNTAADAERHFRQTHLPTLLRSASELRISGVLSRRLPDRSLGRLIENAWSQEIRSPSKMMQELAGGLRGTGLNIFRHRRGMLFVSPIRIRPFSHESTGVSASINSILQALGETPGLNRKQLAEKLAPAEAADAEKAKLTLASDLRWLIHEGYVIEFNDGSLDLPRVKPPPASAAAAEAKEEVATPVLEPTAELPSGEPSEGTSDESGMTVEQSIEPIAEPAKE